MSTEAWNATVYGYCVAVGGTGFGIFPNKESAVLWAEHQIKKGALSPDWHLIRIERPREIP